MMTRRQRGGGDIVLVVPQWLFESATQPAVVLMVPQAKTLEQLGGRLGTGSYSFATVAACHRILPPCTTTRLLIVCLQSVLLRRPVTCTSHLCRQSLSSDPLRPLLHHTFPAASPAFFLASSFRRTLQRRQPRVSRVQNLPHLQQRLPHRVTSVQLCGQRVRFKWQKRFGVR